MIYINLFLAFFIPGIVGYGGGPSTIPLIQKEVVEHYHFMTNAEFSSMLAVGNILPGPIATKLAGYIGYEIAGIPGACIAIFATVAPTTLLMIGLISVLMKFKNSPPVKRITMFVLPVVAVLMLQLAGKFMGDAIEVISWWPSILIAFAAYIGLQRFKWNPAIVIIGGLIVGGLFLS